MLHRQLLPESDDATSSSALMPKAGPRSAVGRACWGGGGGVRGSSGCYPSGLLVINVCLNAAPRRPFQKGAMPAHREPGCLRLEPDVHPNNVLGGGGKGSVLAAWVCRPPREGPCGPLVIHIRCESDSICLNAAPSQR